MMRALVLLALLAACGPHAWTTADTAGQVAVTAMLAVDYRQTSQALEEGGIEHNPVAARFAPEVYFPAVALVAAGAAIALPYPWRSVLQGSIVAVQVDTITGNWIRVGRVF